MTINISLPDVEQNLHPKITVLGVGGSGGNAVNNMTIGFSYNTYRYIYCNYYAILNVCLKLITKEV